MAGAMPRSATLGSAGSMLLLATAFLVPGSVAAPYVIPYKTLQSLTVELHSLRDTVTLYAGNPQQLLELTTHPEDVFPRVELSPGQRATLSIRDQVLLDLPATPDSSFADEEPLPAATTGEMPEAHRWQLLLSPPAPTKYLLRCERGAGSFDFSDLPTQEVLLIGVDAALKMEFHRRNLVPLERCQLVADGGSLEVRELLNGLPKVVSVQCPLAEVDFDVTGKPFDGLLEVFFEGVASRLHLRLSPKIGVQVTVPAAVRKNFAGNRLVERDGVLVTKDYEENRCKLRLFLADAPRSLEVEWE